jgi:hypothetical protein
VALVFLSVVLLTGPVWGKPIWGTWWSWDARLTLTLFLWFVVVGYLVLRGAIDDRAQRARYSAVLGLLAVLLVPFIHLSVYMFRTLHPMPVVLKPERSGLPPEMKLTFYLGPRRVHAAVRRAAAGPTALRGRARPAGPARAGGRRVTPDNGAYLYAAYVLAAFVYGGYAVLLVRRRARVRRALGRGGDGR